MRRKLLEVLERYDGTYESAITSARIGGGDFAVGMPSGDQAHSSARTASAGDENLLQGSGSISYIETRLAVRVTLTPVQSAASTAAPASWSVRQ